MLYFAYGSNMFSPRLRARCPSARFVTTAGADCHDLRFDKMGLDDSGKGNLVPGPNGHHVHGALFELDASDTALLDGFEGPGYRRDDTFSVRRRDTGGEIVAATYIATSRRDGLRPFDWYLALILAGALEHGLPVAQTHALRATPTQPDPDPIRPRRIEALSLLAAAGLGLSALLAD